MAVKSCIPVIPRAKVKRGLRLWVDGLGFGMNAEVRAKGGLIFCMLHRGDLSCGICGPTRMCCFAQSALGR